METTREKILRLSKEIAISTGDLPSLNVIAEDIGLSKGGLLHHFPSRQALVEAIVDDAIEEIDTALKLAEEQKDVLNTWLNLSVPRTEDLKLYSAVYSLFIGSRSNIAALHALIAEAYTRWAQLLEKELKSVEAAKVAVLLGDGLFFSSLTQATSHEALIANKELSRQTINTVAAIKR